MAQITLTRAQALELLAFCRKHGKSQFYIAKDQGAYIGQNDGTSTNCLFYFKGCDPKKDGDDWYETTRALFGGDDFGDMLPLHSLLAVEKLPNVEKVRFVVGKTTIKIQHLMAKEPPPGLDLKLDAETLKQMSISTLARIIRKSWPKPYFGAVPYIDAMLTMHTIEDKYGEDSGASIVAYGISNMQTWRGETARLVKAELNRRLKGHYK